MDMLSETISAAIRYTGSAVVEIEAQKHLKIHAADNVIYDEKCPAEKRRVYTITLTCLEVDA